MIIDRLTNVDTYRALGSGISAAFDFLCSADLAELEPGRHELPNGIYAIVSEYETVAPESKQWEAHRKFIDVQYVVSGAELIGYAPLDTLAPVAGYDEGGDANYAFRLRRFYAFHGEYLCRLLSSGCPYARGRR